jgi:polyhydroxybutyrate depolymerase
MYQREVTMEGKRRIYLAQVPDGCDPETPLPVLVVLHGGGGSAEFASRVHGWSELSQRESCLAVFPEATCEDPSRPAGVRDNPRIWNDGGARCAAAKRGVDDIGYLAAVLDDVQSHFAVDGRRVFVTGFSNGGSMAFRAGIELADRLTAIAPVSGHLCLDQPKPARPLSMLYMIGLADPINPFAGGSTVSPWGSRREKPPIMDSIRKWLRLIGASDQATRKEHANGVTRIWYGPGKSGREVQLYTIEGQGHEWPGAQRTLPSIISGPQTDKLDATQVIWDFFASSSIP